MVVMRRDSFVPGFLALLAERQKLDDLLSPQLALLVPQVVQLLRAEIADPLSSAGSATELQAALERLRPRFTEILAAFGLLIVSHLESTPDEALLSIGQRLRDASHPFASALEVRFGDAVAGNVLSALHTLARSFLPVIRLASEVGITAFLDAFGLLFALEQDHVRDPGLLAHSAREQAMEFSASIKGAQAVKTSQDVELTPPTTSEEDRHFVRLALRDWVARQAASR